MTPEKINAIEFIDNYTFDFESSDESYLYSEEEVYKLVEEYGKQQWNEAIKLAAEEATYQGGGYTLDQEYEYHTPIGVDKQSILKLLK